MRVPAARRRDGAFPEPRRGSQAEAQRNTGDERAREPTRLYPEGGHPAQHLSGRTEGNNRGLRPARHNGTGHTLLLYEPTSLLPDRGLLRKRSAESHQGELRPPAARVARVCPVGTQHDAMPALLLRNEEIRHQRRCQGTLPVAVPQPPRDCGQSPPRHDSFLPGSHTVVPEPIEKIPIFDKEKVKI